MTHQQINIGHLGLGMSFEWIQHPRPNVCGKQRAQLCSMIHVTSTTTFCTGLDGRSRRRCFRRRVRGCLSAW